MTASKNSFYADLDKSSLQIFGVPSRQAGHGGSDHQFWSFTMAEASCSLETFGYSNLGPRLR